jgi:hypothetical protein
MNPARGIWSDLPMSTGIATLVCYAGVFGDVISVEDMASRLGVAGQELFYSALNNLLRQRRLIVRDGYAALPDLGNKIGIKAGKIQATAKLIGSRIEDLKKLGRNPFINFVGISGSLAANNPAKDSLGILDIDVFLITRNQCIWLYEIPKRIRQNLFPKKEPEPKLCINHVMDESDMRVANRNFYTATEIRNLIPVAGLDTFRAFLQANDWIDYYYPGFSGPPVPTTKPNSPGLINKLLYTFVPLLYCIKYRSLTYLRMLTFKTDQSRETNYNRVSSKRGGYQMFVHDKFSRLAAIWYPDLVDEQLVDKLFADELSREIKQGAAEYLNADFYANLRFDYQKYGFQKILPKGSRLL